MAGIVDPKTESKLGCTRMVVRLSPLLVSLSIILLAGCHIDGTEPEPTQDQEIGWQLFRKGAFQTGTIQFETQGFIYSGLGSWTRAGDTEHADANMYRCDPGTKTNISIPYYPSPATYDCVAFGLSGKAYVGGGWHPKGLYSSSEFYEYDPSSNLWTGKASLPEANRNWISFSFNNRGFISLNGRVWEYLPEEDMWIERPEAVPVIPAFNSFRIESKEYLLGSDLYEYDHQTQKWSSKRGVPVTPTFAFVIKQELYAGAAGSFWKYDSAGNQWQRLHECPSKEENLIGYSFLDNGYVATTEHNLDRSDSHDIYRYVPE